MTTNKTITEFVTEAGIKFSFKTAAANPNWDGDRYARHYSCTFKLNGRRVSVPFSMGSGIQHEPRANDVLDCLASDAAGFENTNGFEDWASEYGYDSKSRKALKTYRAVERQSQKLKDLLGDDLYQELLWNTERE